MANDDRQQAVPVHKPIIGPAGWLWTGLIGSWAYLGLLWLITETSGGPLFFWEQLTRATPNELGDFLAGAFAPLAFLWLVIAVLIQAQELKAQRQELATTREEMKLARQVASETRKEIAAQANAATETARFMAEQTRLQELQTKRTETSANDEEALRLTTTLTDLIEANQDGPLMEVVSKSPPYVSLWSVSSRRSHDPALLPEFVHSVTQTVAYIDTINGWNGASMDRKSLLLLQRTVALLAGLQKAVDGASISTQLRFTSYDLTVVTQTLQRALVVISDPPNAVGVDA